MKQEERREEREEKGERKVGKREEGGDYLRKDYVTACMFNFVETICI